MSGKNSAVSPEIYQLKVTLLGTDPPIWRRLLVPSDLNLAQLHDVLQVAMGWQDGHLHEFSAGGRRFGPQDPDDQFMADDVGDERKVRVFGLFGRTGAKALYTKRFWRHLGAQHCPRETPASRSQHDLHDMYRWPTCLSP